MKKLFKLSVCMALAAALSSVFIFSACTDNSDSSDKVSVSANETYSSADGTSDTSSDNNSGSTEETIYVTGISQSEDSSSTFIVTYSDGSTTDFTVETDDITMQDIYNAYLESAEITSTDYSYSDFISDYLTTNYVYNDYSTTVEDNSVNTVTTTDAKYTVAENLLSAVTIYASSKVTTTTTTSHMPGMGFGGNTYTTYDREVYTGSGVIYSIDDDDDGYVYIVTCYHVVYCETLESVANEYICMYLYGSEYEVAETSKTDTYGYIVDYGDTAIDCQFVGGSWAEDVAVLRASKADVYAINDAVQTVTFNESYSVGSTAIAIGNYAGYGLSVTKGTVSVDSEELDLTLGSTTNTFRVMRLDIDIYSGNSGGGLFDSNGYYIGMVNAMTKYFGTEDGSYMYYDYGYAIPATIVKNSIENIVRYADDGNMYTADLGVVVEAASSKYVYDSTTGVGSIVESVKVTSLTSGSAAATMGLEEGDIITAITVDGTTYNITRTFNIDDIELNIYEDSVVAISYTRSGTPATTAAYTVTSDSISKH